MSNLKDALSIIKRSRRSQNRQIQSAIHEFNQEKYFIFKMNENPENLPEYHEAVYRAAAAILTANRNQQTQWPVPHKHINVKAESTSSNDGIVGFRNNDETDYHVALEACDGLMDFQNTDILEGLFHRQKLSAYETADYVARIGAGSRRHARMSH